MPARTARMVEHRYTGGWATAFGTRTTNVVEQGDVLNMPFATTADDIFWELDGGWRKVGGTTQLGAELESGNLVTGVFDYWKQGVSASPTQRKVCHVDTKIKQDGGNDTWADLFTGLEAGKHPNYALFQDLLIMSSTSTSDVPKSWDQTTAQNLAGTPPNFSFCVEHKNRMWAAGVASNPSRLYYCVLEDAEDWVGAGSGSIDVALGDGDRITGLASYKGELLVFKGPYKGSIHRITGSSPSDFARVPFLTGETGLPCVAHSTIFQFNDDVGWMTTTGSIHSLKATAAFGDYNESALSYEIDSYLDTNVKTSILDKAWAQTDATHGRVFFAIPTGTAVVNNVVLVYNYRFQRYNQPNRWSRILSWPAHCLGRYIADGKPRLMSGAADGYVRWCNDATKNVDTTGIIPADVVSPFVTYTKPIQYKTPCVVEVSVTPYGTHDFEYRWKEDKDPEQSETLTAGVQGGTLGTFVLGTDRLQDLSFTEVICDLDTSGDFRWIQHRFRQAKLDHDFHVHGFAVELEPNAGGSGP